MNLVASNISRKYLDLRGGAGCQNQQKFRPRLEKERQRSNQVHKMQRATLHCGGRSPVDGAWDAESRLCC